MQATEPTQTPEPGLLRHLPDGAEPPTPEDPTANGILCGRPRSANQIAEDQARGIENPWRWCRNRSGWKTGHPGRGACKFHGGATPQSEQREARLRHVEMVGPALATLATVMTDRNASESARVRAAEAVLDRAGYPRRMDVSVEEGRASLLARIEAAQQAAESEN